MGHMYSTSTYTYVHTVASLWGMYVLFLGKWDLVLFLVTFEGINSHFSPVVVMFGSHTDATKSHRITLVNIYSANVNALELLNHLNYRRNCD